MRSRAKRRDLVRGTAAELAECQRRRRLADRQHAAGAQHLSRRTARAGIQALGREHRRNPERAAGDFRRHGPACRRTDLHVEPTDDADRLALLARTRARPTRRSKSSCTCAAASRSSRRTISIRRTGAFSTTSWAAGNRLPRRLRAAARRRRPRAITRSSSASTTRKQIAASQWETATASPFRRFSVP